MSNTKPVPSEGTNPDYIVVSHAEVGHKVVEGWKVVREVVKVLMEKPK